MFIFCHGKPDAIRSVRGCLCQKKGKMNIKEMPIFKNYLHPTFMVYQMKFAKSDEGEKKRKE